MPQMEAKLPLNVALRIQGLYKNKKKLGTTWYSSTPSKQFYLHQLFFKEVVIFDERELYDAPF